MTREPIDSLKEHSAVRGWDFQIRDAARIQESRPSNALTEDAWLWVEKGLRLQRDNQPRDLAGSRRWFGFLHAVRRYPVPETFVCAVPDARIAGYCGTVFDDSGRHLRESSLLPALPTAAEVAGAESLPDGPPVVPLLSAWAENNYCHWVFDALSRVALLDNPAACRFLIPSAACSFHHETLQLCGITPDQILQSPAPVLRASTALVARTSSHGAVPHAEVARRLRQRLLDSVTPASPHRRLYLSRAASGRGVRNEKEILPVLQRAGFEIVEPQNLPVAEQARVFSEAEIVLGPHGAAFVNSLFCAPGTRIVELFSPARWNACYLRIGALFGLEHWHLFGERPDKSQSFEVPPARLERLLAYLDDGPAHDPSPF
jgi:hypothetical protein